MQGGVCTLQSPVLRLAVGPQAPLSRREFYLISWPSLLASEDQLLAGSCKSLFPLDWLLLSAGDYVISVRAGPSLSLSVSVINQLIFQQGLCGVWTSLHRADGQETD